MSAEWRSNLGAFEMATDRAIRAGLTLVGEEYVGDVRPQIQRGYTSGKFVTGNAANSVQRGEVERTATGYQIAVGSTQVSPPYPAMWELGHHNHFTGKHERVEIWVPTLVQNREKYMATLASEIRAVDGKL